MTYKVTEEGNIATVFLNDEIDMDVTEKAKEVINVCTYVCKNSRCVVPHNGIFF